MNPEVFFILFLALHVLAVAVGAGLAQLQRHLDYTDGLKKEDDLLSEYQSQFPTRQNYDPLCCDEVHS